jgi:hypothetical protein
MDALDLFLWQLVGNLCQLATIPLNNYSGVCCNIKAKIPLKICFDKYVDKPKQKWLNHIH